MSLSINFSYDRVLIIPTLAAHIVMYLRVFFAASALMSVPKCAAAAARPCSSTTSHRQQQTNGKKKSEYKKDYSHCTILEEAFNVFAGPS